MVDQNSQFYAILTNVGAAKQANADAMGIPWKITQMGVGDANGTDPTPNATQTALIGEWRRAPLNQLKVDDKDNAIIVAEQVIPADVGGRWIREIGLYDADGDLVAVANCAPTYKPLLSQGSGRTQVVRMSLVVSSSSNVQLRIDPSIVLATREWVTEELARQDFKHSVLVATTAPIALNGLQTVDGVSLQAGNRVLVKDQEAAKDNGLYVVAAGAWARSTDADSNAKVTPGLLVLVEKGTANGDSAWQLVTDALITLGVTGLAFEMAFGRTGIEKGTYRSVTVDKYGRVVSATNPTTVAGYGLTDVFTKTQINEALALKAPVDSPVFTGTPKVPTAPAEDSSALAANTLFVKTAIAQLVGGAPGALDTLKELADALGGDADFAGTVTKELAKKANKADSLEGYGIKDDVQIRGKKLVGEFTIECLNTSVEVITGGLLIKTKIPVSDVLMPILVLKGALSGYTSPFEAVVSWYWHDNKIHEPQVIINGVSVGPDAGLKVFISASGGFYNVRLDFVQAAYIPRITVSAIRTEGRGGDRSIYQGWSFELYSVPITGEVQARRSVVLHTNNISDNALKLVRENQLPVAGVNGLAEALTEKANKVHAHSISEVTGLSDAIAYASGLNAGPTDRDPNLADYPVILTMHPNTPDLNFYWHITTTFYSAITTVANRGQIAVQYNGGSRVYVRSCYGGVWAPWDRLDNQLPPGAVVHFPLAVPPPGYLKANGAAVSRTTYARLFAAISTIGGAGDGSTTFNVPDARGEFIRGWDDARGVDINRTLGSRQYSQNASHTHTATTDVQGGHRHGVEGYTTSGGAHGHTLYRALNSSVGSLTDRVTTAQGDGGIASAVASAGDHSHTIYGNTDLQGAHAHTVVINPDGGSEARPRNIALLACIKY